MRCFLSLWICLLLGFSKNLNAGENFIPLVTKPFLDGGDAVAISIGVIKDGKTTVFHHGEIELGGGKTPNSDTLYEIGSITKVFTALMLARDVVGKQLALETPVASLMGESFIMPSYQKDNNHHEIELLHLATHTSRLPRLPDDMFQGANPEDPYAHYDQDRLRASLGAQVLTAAPGGKPVLYSNYGFGLLGFSLAEKHATSYAALLKKSWLTPLGMNSTFVTPPLSVVRAKGYDIAHGDQSFWSIDALAGAGAVDSNLTDMLTFARFCLKPKDPQLSAALELSMKAHVVTNGRAQCLGWQRAADQTTYWHNGQTGGFASYFAFNRKYKVAVCILSSGASPHLTPLGEHLVRCVASGKPKPFPMSRINIKATIDEKKLKALAGKYQLAPGKVFTIKTRNNRLFAKLTGQSFLEVFPESATVFSYRAVKAKLEFVPGKNLTLFQNGQELIAEKLP
ncbi:MAG: serine hydrolase [Akkermansiaceae bacterium]